METAVFRGMKLCISTPMYRSEVCDAYHDSRRELDRYLAAAGIGYYPSKVRDTYLPRARNILSHAFLQTDATHQLLLDSDMGFDPQDVLRMLYHVAANPKMWVIGAAYVQKSIDWNRVIEAVRGKPEITVDELKAAAPGMWTFGGLPEGKYDLGMPVELDSEKPHVATGIMIVARQAYEALKPVTPTYIDKQTGQRMFRFFHCDVEPDTELWLGEDVWFCRELKKAGVRIWVAPWVKSEHWGPYGFESNLDKLIDSGMELPV